MATAKKSNDVTMIQIKPLDIKSVPIRIVGDSPLIVHTWSEKAKRQMLEAQMKTTKTSAREAKNPVADFMGSLCWLTEMPNIDGKSQEDCQKAFANAVKKGAKFGFSVGAIKQAANSAAYRLGWVKNQMALRGSYFIRSEYGEFAEIKGCIPEMREDMVRVGMGSADIRYRGEFKSWYMDLLLEYNGSGNMTLEQIINCLSAGGYCVGLGEWRVEKDGDFGRFHVETR